jgi:ABC-type branched-subunit amino acid transport system substrate-binding protein
MSRPRFCVIAAVLVAIPLAALVTPTPAQQGPIRIGFMTDLTGPAAQAAKDMVNGITLYLDEIRSQRSS